MMGYNFLYNCVFPKDHASHSRFGNRNSRFSAILLAFVAALFLVNLPLLGFVDRVNYLSYIRNSASILSSYHSLSLLTNEPLWLLINIVLHSFMSSGLVLRTLIFIPAFVTFYLVTVNRNVNFIFLLAFFLYPDAIRLNIIWLRQGLAFSIFLLGWYSSNRFLKIFLYALTPFIHSSFFIILLILFLEEYFKSNKIDPRILCAAIGLFFFAISFFIVSTASYFGFRQGAEYSTHLIMVSGKGFLFWSLLLGLVFFEGSKFVRSNLFQLLGLIFYLATYFTFQYSFRIWSSFLLLFFISCSNLTGFRKTMFFCMFFMIFCSAWCFNTFQ